MAHKWKRGNVSSLVEDLDLSSSDDDEVRNIFNGSSKEEEKLLSDAIQPGANEPIPSTSSSSVAKSTEETNARSVLETQASTSREEVSVSRAQGREITYDGIQGKLLSLAENKTGKDRTGAEINLDLDEICQQRNILPPSRAPRRHHSHHFHYDRPITGARKKFYSIDPRQNLSLDEIIRMVPSGGRNDHQTIKRRPHNAEGNWRVPSQQKQHVLKNEKLKQGLQSIIKPHPNLGNVIFGNASANQGQESQVEASRIPEWTRNTWQCVLDLIHKGYSIYWSLIKLKQDEAHLTEDQKSRLYKCNVSYNQVEGICEAGNALQAKHGAAANFLVKMKAEFPLLGKLTMKVDEAILLDPSLVRILIDKLKEKYGQEVKFHFQARTERVNNRNLFKTTFSVQSSTYEGYSYLSDRASKLMAGKQAFEKELGSCPVQKIHLGKEECTTDQALYRGVESQMVHCLDFSRATMLDPEAVRTTVSNGNKASTSRNSSFQRRHGRDIHVSFVDPTSK